jgi:alkylhydroperoxidase family enzyme
VEQGDGELVEAIKEHRWRELANLSERDRALCAVAEKLSASPTQMMEGDWGPLRGLGFGDRELLEVAHIICLFNYLTRLADGFGLQLDAGTLEAGREGVPLRRPPHNDTGGTR